MEYPTCTTPAIEKCPHRLFHSYFKETKKEQKTTHFQFLYLFFLHALLIQLTLSMVIYTILAISNHPVAHKDLGRIQKKETASCVTGRSVVPIEPNRHCKRLIERNANEKY